MKDGDYMPRCIFCNKFSFSLSKGVCKNCFSYYANDAKRTIEQIIPELFKPVDDESSSLESRSKALKKLKDFFDDFLNSQSGEFCCLFDMNVINQVKREIKETEESIKEMIAVKNARERNRIDLEKRKKEGKNIIPLNYSKETVKSMQSSYSGKTDNYNEQYSKITGTPDSYIVFDLETTGFNKVNDKILEIGAIRYVNNAEEERFHSYVNPHRRIPREATAVNHITLNTVKDAPDIDSVLKDFIIFIGNYPLIAYNSDFDMNFIQYNCQCEFGITLDNDVIDALPLARKYLSELPNKKLETVKQHFKLKVGSHNAIDDCIVTNHLYQYCKQYEADRFKYVIPFTYEFQELNDTEVEYLNTVVEILEKHGIKKSYMGLKYTSKYLEVYDNREGRNNFDIRIKMYGKLQYVLLEVPISEFQEECKTEIKYTEGNTSERGMTRIFTENPGQLWEFEDFFVNKKRYWNT